MRPAGHRAQRHLRDWGWPRLDVPDPDGTVVRFHYYTGPTDRFTGIEMRDGQVVGTYDAPRL
jgi:hypothetical protein